MPRKIDLTEVKVFPALGSAQLPPLSPPTKGAALHRRLAIEQKEEELLEQRRLEKQTEEKLALALKQKAESAQKEAELALALKQKEAELAQREAELARVELQLRGRSL